MGRGRRGKSGRNNNNKGGNVREDAYHSASSSLVMNNKRFEAFYKAQNIIQDDEWETFMDKLRQPLPVTFRVAGSREIAKGLNNIIKNNYVPSLADTTFEGERVPPPVQLPWYPDGLAWQFDVAKKVLRKHQAFKKFHSFIVFETDVGNISRQEAVSMVPPLFLDVEPHHRVLDMCAAPGSKTAQLLEALHANDKENITSVPPGLVIANDSDYKRTHLLIHQSLRLPSPAFMVTNLDASSYPTMKIAKDKKLYFDRILADVPCSGDGTLRKNAGIWKKWSPQDGNGLHSVQVRILQRAMKLLAPGGRIVYSTCSLNPIENEAVIAAALNTYPEFELVDVSERYPELIRRPGINTWKPTPDRDVGPSSFYDSYEAYIQSLEGTNVSSKILPTQWPPANVAELGLEKCMRIYPHLQDTGGFFVAVIERRVKQRPKAVSKELKREASPSVESGPEPKKPRLEESSKDASTPTAAVEVDEPESQPGGTFKENPYIYLAPEDPILQVCIEKLHLLSSFPRSHILVRNPSGTALRALYMTNDLVRSVITWNDYSRIRLGSAGTKVFVKQEAARKEKESGVADHGQFRVLGEGLPVVLPFVDESWILEGTLNDLRVLTGEYYPLCAHFEQPFRGIMESRDRGCHVVRFKVADIGDQTLLRDIVLPIWKSDVSMTLMIDKRAKSALSLRLFGEDITTAGKEARNKIRNADAPADIVVAEGADDINVEAEENDAAEEEEKEADMSDVDGEQQES